MTFASRAGKQIASSENVTMSPTVVPKGLFRPMPLRLVRARPRLFGCIALAIIAGLVLPRDWSVVTRALLAWNIGTWCYLALAATMMFASSHETMRARVETQDEGRHTILVLASMAAIASLGSIIAQLSAVKNLTGFPKFLELALAGATILGSWLFIHMTFALHYAHEYFLERRRTGPADRSAGGLIFPGTDTPDYPDFLYFSYVIGVASQTADVEITSRRIRRVSLAHSIVSFFFNTTILALTINIAAGLF